MSTVAEPFTMESGGPTHVAMLPTVAAGTLPMSTVGTPGGIIGPPTCGTGGTGGTVGFCMGHVCISPTLAAGGILSLSLMWFQLIDANNSAFDLRHPSAVDRGHSVALDLYFDRAFDAHLRPLDACLHGAFEV